DTSPTRKLATTAGPTSSGLPRNVSVSTSVLLRSGRSSIVRSEAGTRQSPTTPSVSTNGCRGTWKKLVRRLSSHWWLSSEDARALPQPGSPAATGPYAQVRHGDFSGCCCGLPRRRQLLQVHRRLPQVQGPRAGDGGSANWTGQGLPGSGG